eukprot:3814998-Lingulodinium_polyedra.AAC.1
MPYGLTRTRVNRPRYRGTCHGKGLTTFRTPGVKSIRWLVDGRSSPDLMDYLGVDASASPAVKAR